MSSAVTGSRSSAGAFFKDGVDVVLPPQKAGGYGEERQCGGIRAHFSTKFSINLV